MTSVHQTNIKAAIALKQEANAKLCRLISHGRMSSTRESDARATIRANEADIERMQADLRQCT